MIERTIYTVIKHGVDEDGDPFCKQEIFATKEEQQNGYNELVEEFEEDIMRWHDLKTKKDLYVINDDFSYYIDEKGRYVIYTSKIISSAMSISIKKFEYEITLPDEERKIWEL